MNRRWFVAIAGGIAFGTAGCNGVLEAIEGDDGEVDEEDLPAIVVLGTPINEEIETYHVTLNGDLNEAQRVEVRHGSEVVYTMTEDIEDPITVMDSVEKGEYIQAVAIVEDENQVGDREEIVDETEVA